MAAVSAAMLIGLALFVGFPMEIVRTAEAASVTMHLYATVLGWSTSPSGETNPGPTLQVNQGDQVTITLTSDDGLAHGLFIDYNGNGAIDGSDFSGPSTSTQVTFSLIASNVGSFNYYDKNLPPFDPVLSTSHGIWTTSPSNSPPTAAITAPVAGTSWTGGASHTIVYTASDPDGDAIRAYLNYSYHGGTGSGAIAGPLTPGSGPNTVSWTPSGFDATDTIVRLTVLDSRGAVTSVDSPAFEVDSTAPTIASTSPGPGATQVGLGSMIWITWSEGMNTAAAGNTGSFGVRVTGGPWVAGTASWSPDAKQMTFHPSAQLSPATSYDVHVNTTATDHSDPGNALAAAAVWSFTTSSSADSTPPSILSVNANPPVQASGGYVNLTAEAQDDVGMGGVSAIVTGPSFDETLTMTHASGNLWYVNRTYATGGVYNVTFEARDTSGNAASTPTNFRITNESSGGGPPIPAPASVSASILDNGSVWLTWTAVSTDGLIGYHVYRSMTAGGKYARLTARPVPATASPTYNDASVKSGTYYYVITSVNRTNAESVYSGEIRVMTSGTGGRPPVFDLGLWAVAGVTLGMVLGAIYGLAWRRRPA